jgi:hypothetical protein
MEPDFLSSKIKSAAIISALPAKSIQSRWDESCRGAPQTLVSSQLAN